MASIFILSVFVFKIFYLQRLSMQFSAKCFYLQAWFAGED